MTDISSAELNHVLSLLRKLTAQQRRHVVSYIGKLDGEVSIEHGEDWLLPGIEYELKRRGLLMVPLTKKRLAQWAPNYTEHSRKLRAGLEAYLHHSRTQLWLLAFGKVCARSLVEYLIKDKFSDTPHTVGPQIVFRNMADLPTAIERSFPGYMTSGTLPMVVRG